jgi:hypothetical protein
MIKKLSICLILLTMVFSLTSCGGGSSSSSEPGGVNAGVASKVEMLPVQQIGQTNSYIYFKAKVLDGNGQPLPGARVTFTNVSAPFGTIEVVGKTASSSGKIASAAMTTGITDSLGFATARVFSSVSGFATVQAEVSGGTGVVRDKRTVFFSEFDLLFPTPPPPTLTIEVDTDNDGSFNDPGANGDFFLFKTPGDNQVLVRITVLDGDGFPVSGSTVTLGADSTDASFPLGNVKVTDMNGRVTTLMEVNPSFLTGFTTTLTITATADNGAANMLTMFLNPITVSTLSVTANPAFLAPGGSSSITAVVGTTAGTPAPNGTAVTFGASCLSQAALINPVFAQTTNGQASATFTAPAMPDTCTVTAKSGGLNASAQIIVSTQPANPSLLISPATVTVLGAAPADVLAFTITGGTPPYTTTSSDPSKAYDSGPGDGSWTGSSIHVTVPAGASGGTVTLNVADSVGDAASATITIIGAGALNVLPDTKTITDPMVNDTATYTVIGGSAPYTVFSDNPALVSVGIVGGTLTATVLDVPPIDTTVNITVLDSVGATKTVKLVLDVPPLVTLNVVPASQTRSMVNDTADYTIIGGVPAYDAVSDHPELVSLAIVNTTLTATVDALPLTDTTVNITVLDHVGSTKTVTLIVLGTAPAPLDVTPSTATVVGVANPDGGDTSDDVTFTITGGSPPYSVSSDTPAVITSPGLLVGNVFTVDPDSVTSPTVVTLTVTDNDANTKQVTVTVNPVPLSITVDKKNVIGLTNSDGGNTSDDVTITVQGGTAPYVVSSSNPSLTPPGTWPIASSGGTAVTDVNGVASITTVTLTVHDNVGNTATTTVTIYPPSIIPLSISLDKLNVIGLANSDGGNTSDDVTFTVTGGVPPYVVSSNNAPLTPPGAWAVASSGGGDTTDVNAVTSITDVVFTVNDNVGNTAQVTLKIYPSSASLPLSISLDKLNVIGVANPDGGDDSDDVQISVSGGTAPYVITSDLPSLTPSGTWSLMSAGSVTTDANNVGAATVVTFTVADNAGHTNDAKLTIYPQQTGLVISVDKPDVIGLPNPDGQVVDTIHFYVSGGTPPYVVSAATDGTNQNGNFIPNGPWNLVADGQVTIDPEGATAFGTPPVIVTLTAQDNNGAIATTTVTIH